MEITCVLVPQSSFFINATWTSLLYKPVKHFFFHFPARICLLQLFSHHFPYCMQISQQYNYVCSCTVNVLLSFLWHILTWKKYNQNPPTNKKSFKQSRHLLFWCEDYNIRWIKALALFPSSWFKVTGCWRQENLMNSLYVQYHMSMGDSWTVLSLISVSALVRHRPPCS